MDGSFYVGLFAGAIAGAVLSLAIVSVALRVSRHHYETLLQKQQTRVDEAALQALATNEQLRRANEDLEQFAYIASHDLKEPLRTIRNYIEIFFEDFGDQITSPEAHTYRRYIADAADRASQLISDLLDFSRAGRNVQPELFSMEDAIRDAITELNGSLVEKNVEVIYDDDLPVVTADRGMIVRVLANLFSNSIKFRHTDMKTLIQVAHERVYAGVVVHVRDNGIGIASEHFPIIFDAFRRLYSQAEYPGTGIGLALCRRIVHAHGGEIWATSDGPGKGTQISFLLPHTPSLPEEDSSGNWRPLAINGEVQNIASRGLGA